MGRGWSETVAQARGDYQQENNFNSPLQLIITTTTIHNRNNNNNNRNNNNNNNSQPTTTSTIHTTLIAQTLFFSIERRQVGLGHGLVLAIIHAVVSPESALQQNKNNT